MRTDLSHAAVLLRAVGVAAVLVFVCSCTTGPRKVENPAPLPDEFSRSGQEQVPGKWWTALDDPHLSGLVDEALEENFDLKTAWDRLDQARAVARRQGAALWPQLDGSASASRTAREQTGATFQGGLQGGQGAAATFEQTEERTYRDEFSLGLTANYEVDLWGRVRASADAARFSARASAQDVRAAALSLSAQVATTWYRLVSQRAQLALLDSQISTNQQYLDLVELRFQKGSVSATDVLQQRKLLESTRTEKARARRELKTLRHQLAVLLGRAPGEVELPASKSLPDLPGLPDTGVPARFVRRRPDIRSAYLRVKSSDRNVAAAIADRYPRFTISGNFQTTALEPSALLEEWLASVAGQMTAPILDGGRREAEVDRTRAALSESLHNYGQTVLTAVREVEDALSNEQQQRAALEGVRRELRLSDRTVDQLMQKYRNGTVEFLRVLDELRTHQQLQRNLISARFALIQDRVDLYRALGGTWNLDRPADAAGPQPADSGSASGTGA